MKSVALVLRLLLFFDLKNFVFVSKKEFYLTLKLPFTLPQVSMCKFQVAIFYNSLLNVA